MAKGHVRTGMLRRLRRGGGIVTRLLLFALCIQLAAPLSGASATQMAETALRADLIASLCHQGDSGAATPSQSSAEAKHCVFCLPTIGGAGWTAAAPAIPAPTEAAARHIVPADHQAPKSSRPVGARSRAPPSAPRYA